MVVVIGHYPDYRNVATALGAIVFEVPMVEWLAWSDSRRWSENAAFLDRAMASDAAFLLATPPSEARPGSFYRRELDYLADEGYRAHWNGTSWELRR